MAETTIQWTWYQLPNGTWVQGYTFNPWISCTRVSPACGGAKGEGGCYAEATAENRMRSVLYRHIDEDQRRVLKIWGPQAPRFLTTEAYWQKPHAWNRKAEKEGTRPRVFCASFSDVFEDFHGQVIDPRRTFDTLDGARALLWETIYRTPNLLWLLLTKRPENVLRMVPRQWLYDADYCNACDKHGCLSETKGKFRVHARCGGQLYGWPSNVWIGFTGENQEWFDRRWAHAQRIPAPVIFASIEPQLGPVVLPADFLARGQRAWAIVGGESGPGSRPFNPAWADWIISQCRPAGVPAFVKQMGANPTLRSGSGWGPIRDKKGGKPEEWSPQLRVREIPAL